jgi:hypothetical protein
VVPKEKQEKEPFKALNCFQIVKLSLSMSFLLKSIKMQIDTPKIEYII